MCHFESNQSHLQHRVLGGPERHSSQIRVCANTVDSASFFIYSDKHGDFCCTLVTLNILDNFISCFSRKVSAKKNITSKIILLYLLYAIYFGTACNKHLSNFSSSVIAFRISCAFCVTEAEGDLALFHQLLVQDFRYSNWNP